MIHDDVAFLLPSLGRITIPTLLPLGEGWEADSHFTREQLHWLEMIRDHIAENLGIELDDFELAPFTKEGGLGKVHQLFDDKLNAIIEELNETLVA